MLFRPMLALLLCSVVTYAQAASIHVEQLSSGTILVTVEGVLVASDSDEFGAKVAPLSSATVIFNSDGGNLIAGMKIGQLIRLRKFETWIPNDAKCASACAVAWLGGTRRLMGTSALIGFHAAARDGKESGIGNALMGKYLADLGFSYNTIAHMTKATPNSMTWMNAREAERIGIELTVLDSRTTATRGSVIGELSSPKDLLSRQQERAGEFLTELYSAISSSNSEALSVLSGAYDETVNYFGKPTSRNQILAYYSRILDRWPQRAYKPRGGSVDIRCDSGALACVAKGTLDFDARSPARNERYRGAAKFEFGLKFPAPDAAPMITTETGAVLERRVESLREPPVDMGKHR
jgi:hypothetical protein